MNQPNIIESLIAKKLTILLAEDDEFNRIYFEKAIAKIACNLEIVEDGKQALDLCLKNKYDLIFVDLHMPFLNGIEVISKTKENQQNINYNSPFVSITGTAAASEINDIMNAGFSEVLKKPFTPTELVELVFMICGTNTTDEKSTICLNKLKELYGDDTEIISDLLKAIKSALPQYIDKINEPNFYSDIASMKFFIHKIKPSFGYLGIDFTLFDLDEVENELATGKIPGNIKDICTTLVNTSTKAITDIEQVLKN